MIKNWLSKLKGPTAELKVNEELKENEVMSVKAQKEMTEMAREELISRIKALDAEELKLVVDTIPVELCYNRIGEELQKFKEAKKRSKEALDVMK